MSNPRFMEQADLDDPSQVFAWLIADWPKVGETQPYPAPPVALLPSLSQWLVDMGCVFDPDKAVLRKVRTDDGVDFIPVDDPDPVLKDSGEPDTVIELLRTVDPALAEHIENMPPEKRKAEMLVRRSMFEDAVQVLRDLGGDV